MPGFEGLVQRGGALKLIVAALAAVAVGVTGLAPVGAGSGETGGDSPAGNNGHIQIDEFVMDGGSGNDPHVACGFSVSFFGYDAGEQHATITVTPWSPTSGGSPFTVSTDWQTEHRTSGNQLDANVPISADKVAAAFAGVAPAKQGYHAKITVHVTGSQGSDAKHKVLWIEPCASAATSSAAPAGPAPAEATASPTDGESDNGAVLAAEWTSSLAGSADSTERLAAVGGAVLAAGWTSSLAGSADSAERLALGGLVTATNVSVGAAAVAINRVAITTG